MRIDTPRVPLLKPEEMDPEIRSALGDGPVLNIFRGLANHPKLLKRWLVFGNHVLNKSTLAPRERELVILRIGWLCRAEYEWAQHAAIGKGAGLTAEEIERIAEGPDAAGWSDLEQALLRATDELHGDAFVGDETWKALSAHLDTRQLLDLVFTVGQYNMVSMALNTLGVPLEAGAEGFPER